MATLGAKAAKNRPKLKKRKKPSLASNQTKQQNNRYTPPKSKQKLLRRHQSTSFCLSKKKKNLSLFSNRTSGARFRRSDLSSKDNYIQVRHQEYKSLQKYKRLQEFYHFTGEVITNTTGVRRKMKERGGVARRCVVEGGFPGGPVPIPRHLRTEAGWR